MNFLAFAPFLRYTVFFIAGIFLYYQISEEFYYSYGLFIVFLFLYVLFFLLQRRVSAQFSLFTGISGTGLLILYGYIIAAHHDELQNPLNLSSAAISTKHALIFTGKIIDEPQKTTKNHKLLTSIDHYRDSSGWHSVTGKTWLYIKKKADDSLFHCNYGDKFLVKGKLLNIKAPSNPGVFNYKRYCRLKGVTHQSFISHDQIIIRGNDPPNRILLVAIKTRNFFKNIIENHIKDPVVASVIKAISLGKKENLTNETRSIFADTGVIHILAVSGLHVGILYQALSVLFGFIPLLKSKKWISSLLIITIIWFYAFITGLSPSILRASAMFSFIIAGNILSREHNIYNSLSISAFCLLCIEPAMIYEAGFQLSYFAVLGIVYLQPRIYRLTSLNNQFTDTLWKLTSVTLAAQIATVPLTMYYFNQFPVYFIFTNLLAIPAAFVILSGSFLLFFTYYIPYVAIFIGNVLSYFVKYFYAVLDFFYSLPFSAIKNIYLPFHVLILIFLLMAFILIFIEKRRIGYLIIVLVIVSTVSFFQVYKTWKVNNQKALTVYKRGYSYAIDFFEGDQCYFYNPDTLSNNQLKYAILPNRIMNGIDDTYKIDTFKTNTLMNTNNYVIMQWHNKSFLLVNNNGHYLKEALKNYNWDYIIVKGNNYNKNAWIKEMNVKNKIIISGMKPYHLNFDSEKIHLLESNGAYTLNFNS